jgi:hypothetical protein
MHDLSPPMSAAPISRWACRCCGLPVLRGNAVYSQVIWLAKFRYLWCSVSPLFPSLAVLVNRLQQLANSKDDGSTGSIDSKTLLANVHIEQCYNTEHIHATLSNQIPAMCQEKGLKLLIIDR